MIATTVPTSRISTSSPTSFLKITSTLVFEFGLEREHFPPPPAGEGQGGGARHDRKQSAFGIRRDASIDITHFSPPPPPSPARGGGSLIRLPTPPRPASGHSVR